MSTIDHEVVIRPEKIILEAIEQHIKQEEADQKNKVCL